MGRKVEVRLAKAVKFCDSLHHRPLPGDNLKCSLTSSRALERSSGRKNAHEPAQRMMHPALLFSPWAGG
jgi:hypothetical protein